LVGTSSSDDSLNYAAPNQIERFIFDDGTSMDFKQIIAAVIANNETAGDDVVYGSATADTLDGGAGNDYLTGGTGSDTYVFGKGYGHDVIQDDAQASILFGDPDTDVLKFKDGLQWSDFDYLRDGDSDTLTMRISGTSDQVTITSMLATDPFHLTAPNKIEQFQFADGTVWDTQKLLQHFIDVYATSGNDALYGFGGLDSGVGFTFDGGAGDDLLAGQGGNDTYVFGQGYGHDTILDAGGNDTVQLKGLASTDVTFSRTALDLIITINATGETLTLKDQYVRDNQQGNAVENFVFTDKTLSYTQFNPDRMPVVTTTRGQTLEGSDFAETLDGRAYDATLIGHDGGDTYVFDVGYGHETIADQRVRAAWEDRAGVKVPVDDVVQLGKGITRDTVVFTKDGDDLVISVKGATDTLRIVNQFLGLDNQVEKFAFYDNSDGTPDYLTANDVAQLLQVAAGNIGDNVITGLPDVPNTLDGGPGDDTLIGGNAADTYAFSAGYGFDTIIEKGDVPGVNDKVVFGASVKADAIKLSRNGSDLIIDLGNGTDVLTIQDGLGTHTVEQYLFSDGSTWTLDDIRNKLLVGTDGDDQIVGFDNRDDTLAGGKGSDALSGGSGNDTYKFNIGDGQDSIYDSAGNDTLAFGTGITQDKVTFTSDGDNLIARLSTGDSIVILGGLGATPVENFTFSDGSALTLTAVKALISAAKDMSGQDAIDMGALGAGATVEATAGNDLITIVNNGTLLFRAGDGIDRLRLPDQWWSVSQFTIGFPDLTSTDVTVRFADGNSGDAIISFGSVSDELIIPGILYGINNNASFTLSFADGVSWSNAQLLTKVVSAQGASGSPLILGTSGNDTIAAGAGTHEIRGNGGNDTFIFHKGDGTQTIADTSRDGNVLTISGYAASAMTVTRAGPGQNLLVLTFAGTTDTISLEYDGYFNGVAKLVFDDGTTISRDQLFASAVGRGTSGDDVLVGSSAAEVFTGGKGNDTLIGGGGADTYVFNRGDGRDTIRSNGATDGKAIVAFGTGITKSDIVATRDTSGNITLSLTGTNDAITLVTPSSGPDGIVSGVTFADGTSWSYSDIALSIAVKAEGDIITVPSGSGTSTTGVRINGASGNDTLTGGRGNDILVGGKGDDTLSGGYGADSYVFNLGDGQDNITDNGDTDASILDRLVFGAGIAPTDLTLSSNGRDLVIKVGNGDDRLTIKDMYDNAADQIEQFAFSDGTIWSLSDINLKLAKDSITDGNLIINGSFERSGTGAYGTNWGVDSPHGIPGWVDANGADFELVNGNGVAATDGTYWLDMDQSYRNMDISQIVSGMTAGERLVLSFDYATRASPRRVCSRSIGTISLSGPMIRRPQHSRLRR
jgi:Ca2+-binding RTX toxin-like protein